MREAIPTEIEALFRRESRRLISVLTRILGPGNLELAEDVMQDSFIAAMREWTGQGVPDNPSALAGWQHLLARSARLGPLYVPHRVQIRVWSRIAVQP
jgi:predicted RNA polymerase sigma factor